MSPAAGDHQPGGRLPAPRPEQAHRDMPERVISPGSPNVFRGRLVVIYGTGAGSGLFVYSGTPGLGNAPILAVTTASTDPYGNAVTPSAITDSGMPILIYSGAPATGNLVASFAPAAGTDAFGNPYLQGLTSYINGGGGTNDAAQVNGDSVTFYAPLVGGQNVQLAQTLQILPNPAPFGVTLYGTGAASVPPILASDNPAGLGAPEKWHTLALQSGCVAGNDINGALYTPAYMMLPTGKFRLKGVVSAPAAGLASGTTWAAITQAAYLPTTNIPTALCSNGSHGTIAHAYIRPNGNLQFNAALGANVSMFLDNCEFSVYQQ